MPRKIRGRYNYGDELMTPSVVQLPNDWRPRDYQTPLWDSLTSGTKRAVAVWHRRAGKDSVMLNWTAVAAHQRVGLYWHMLPKANQGRKVIWDGIDKSGRRMIDQAFPKEIRKSAQEQEMRIRLSNGSMWQVVGSDNYDALVGSNPVGVVFSEWSIANPKAWDYIRPILVENGGWAVFIYTPRGKNHGYRTYETGRRHPEMFCQRLTIEDTKAVPKSVIEEERQQNMSEDLIQQEYYCSFEAANPGAYYANQMRAAHAETRITCVPPEQSLPVNTAWDLGIGDATAIWFYQLLGKEIRMVNYYEASGEALGHYFTTLEQWRSKYDVRWGEHFAPWDINVRELSTGRSRLETSRKAGWTFRPLRRIKIEEGVEMVRQVLPMCWFDQNACELGISALSDYSKDWDEKAQCFRQRPRHDWSSHGADAFRYLSQAVSTRLRAGNKMAANAGSWQEFKIF